MPLTFYAQQLPFERVGKGTIMGKKRTNVKQRHLKGIKLGTNLKGKKKFTHHSSKPLRYVNVNIVEGILDGMSRVGLDLKPKPKLMGEGKGLKRELRAPPHYLRLKYKRSNNAFGDELSLDA